MTKTIQATRNADRVRSLENSSYAAGYRGALEAGMSGIESHDFARAYEADSKSAPRVDPTYRDLFGCDEPA